MYNKIVMAVKMLVLVTIVALFVWMGRCIVLVPTPADDDKPVVGKKIGLKSRVIGVKITDKNIEGEVLKLDAKEAWVSNSFMELEDINATFKSTSNKPLLIVADKAILENATNDGIFTGDVRIESQRPFVLETERLDWAAGQRLLTTEKEILYNADDVVISGRGMIIDVETHDVTILSEVDATFN